jgi:hypothetical protein
MQLVAANQMQREADLSDRRAATMQHMGDSLVQMGSPQIAPPVICNHYAAQTICH